MAPLPMSQWEVEDLGRELSTWVGAQLQEILIDGQSRPEGGQDPKSIRLGFFWSGGIRWLVFDYLIQAPCVVLFDGQSGVPMAPPKPAKIRRPIELFLRSAFVGKRLTKVSVRRDEGRALTLEFQNEPLPSRLEFKIAPHGRNLTAVGYETLRGKTIEKQISEFKPTVSRMVGGKALEMTMRPRHQLTQEWLERNPGRQKKEGQGKSHSEVAEVSSPKDRERERLIEKRRRALLKVQDEIAKKETSPAREIGEWLKESQALAVKPEWESFIDRRKSFSENLERLFRLAKTQERKVEGTRERARELEAEIKNLETGALSSKERRDERDLSFSTSATAGKDLFSQAGARGRKVEIAPDLLLYIGKNAAENLAILRKAQPFDYWLHIKDQPGAHAIVRRPRGREVKDAEFSKAGIALLEQSMKRRAIELKGEAYDILIVECRFVRPIKGDRLGRVHYSNDRVLRIRC